MAKSQQNGITILLVLKGYQMGEVWEDDKGIVVQITLGVGEVSCPIAEVSSKSGEIVNGSEYLFC